MSEPEMKDVRRDQNEKSSGIYYANNFSHKHPDENRVVVIVWSDGERTVEVWQENAYCFNELDVKFIPKYWYYVSSRP